MRRPAALPRLAREGFVPAAPETYDRTRDDEELRKVKRQVNALAAKKRKRAGIEDRKEARP